MRKPRIVPAFAEIIPYLMILYGGALLLALVA